METSGSTAERAQKPPRSAGPTPTQAASGGLKWDGNGSRGALLVIMRHCQIAFLHKHSPLTWEKTARSGLAHSSPKLWSKCIHTRPPQRSYTHLSLQMRCEGIQEIVVFSVNAHEDQRGFLGCFCVSRHLKGKHVLTPFLPAGLTTAEGAQKVTLAPSGTGPQLAGRRLPYTTRYPDWSRRRPRERPRSPVPKMAIASGCGSCSRCRATLCGFFPLSNAMFAD